MILIIIIVVSLILVLTGFDIYHFCFKRYKVHFYAVNSNTSSSIDIKLVVDGETLIIGVIEKGSVGNPRYVEVTKYLFRGMHTVQGYIEGKLEGNYVTHIYEERWLCVYFTEELGCSAYDVNKPIYLGLNEQKIT